MQDQSMNPSRQGSGFVCALGNGGGDDGRCACVDEVKGCV